MKSILINILTHGDELIGVKVADEIENKYSDLLGKELAIQIANEDAYKQGKRFVDEDLNRCFPGNLSGNYEQKRAATIISKLREYDIVIDIHSTKSETKDTVIITRTTPLILKTIEIISPANVFLMNINPEGALIHHCQNGLALEFGHDTSDDVLRKNLVAIDAVINYFLFDKITAGLELSTQYYEVFRQVEKPTGATLLPEIKNFSLVKANEIFAKTADGKPVSLGEDFYPVIFGQDNYETIFGFAARKVKSFLV